MREHPETRDARVLRALECFLDRSSADEICEYLGRDTRIGSVLRSLRRLAAAGFVRYTGCGVWARVEQSPAAPHTEGTAT